MLVWLMIGLMLAPIAIPASADVHDSPTPQTLPTFDHHELQSSHDCCPEDATGITSQSDHQCEQDCLDCPHLCHVTGSALVRHPTPLLNLSQTLARLGDNGKPGNHPDDQLRPPMLL